MGPRVAFETSQTGSPAERVPDRCLARSRTCCRPWSLAGFPEGNPLFSFLLWLQGVLGLAALKRRDTGGPPAVGPSLTFFLREMAGEVSKEVQKFSANG